MINCQNCNTQVPEGTRFCTNCGAPIAQTPTVNENSAQNTQYNNMNSFSQSSNNGYMPNQANSVSQNNNFQNNGYQNYPPSQPSQPMGYNQPQYPVNNGYSKEDKANVGLCVLSVLIPIFGVIYFFCVRKDKPKEAKACLKSGLISAGCILVLTIVMVAVIIGGVFGIVNKAIDDVDTDVDINWSYNEDYDDEDDDWYDWDYDYDDEDEDDITDDVSSETSVSNSQTTNLSADWKDYAFVIDGKTYNLPISYSDFSSQSGFTFKSNDDAESTLKNNYYNIVTLTNGDKKVHVSILNNTGALATQKEGTIVGISNYDDESCVTYAGGLYAGQEITKDEIITILGEPDYTYDGDNDYWSLKWYEDYDSYYSANKFAITLYKGVITDIDMDRQVY